MNEMKATMELAEINAIIEAHLGYWANEQPVMDKLTLMMKQELFRTTGYFGVAGSPNSPIVIEPAYAHSLIEVFMANLSPKAPAVIVGPDIKGEGNPVVVEALSNRYMYDQAALIDRLQRIAIVYPYAFMKLAILPDGSVDNIVDQIDMRPISPWDVLVDFDADKFDNSRYVGHRYWMPLREAKKRWPNIRFNGQAKTPYLNAVKNQTFDGVPDSVCEGLMYAEIFEIFDIQNDELIFVSTNAERKDKVLEVVSPIPFRKYNGRPLLPLCPLYFHEGIDVPLQGESTLWREFDGIVAKINLRTIWANAIAKGARQIVTRKGSMDTDAKTVFSENIDCGIIELDLKPNESIGDCIIPLPNVTLSPDFSTYEALTNQDLTVGSMLGSFTQGVATGASATEVAGIMQYSSSELGKMSRIRDRAIENIAETYIGLLAFLMLTSKTDKETLTIKNEPVTVTSKDLIGKFKFSAADQSSTPLGAAMRRANTQAVVGMLQGLGVPASKLTALIVDAFDLDPTMKEAAEEAAKTAPIVQGGQEPVLEAPAEVGGVNPPLPVGGGSVAASIRESVG